MDTSERNQPAIGLVGYGRMGREIEQAAHARGITINAIVDIRPSGIAQPIERSTLEAVDVCIEFTVPEAVVGNIRMLASLGKHIVVGTTGWHAHMQEVREIVADHGIGLIHAGNFSIGVHLFLALARQAGLVFNAHPEYDVAIHETHHRMKIDAPSGTAIRIAENVLQTCTRKTRWTAGAPDGPVDPMTLGVSSTRVGTVPGTHELIFDSGADTIALVHTARNRRGFADGALTAAQWIHGRKGIFTMEDMLDELGAA